MEVAPLLCDIQHRLHETMKKQSLELSAGTQSTAKLSDYIRKRAFGTSRCTSEVNDLTLFGEFSLNSHAVLLSSNKNTHIAKQALVIIATWVMSVLYCDVLNILQTSVLQSDSHYGQMKASLGDNNVGVFTKKLIYIILNDNTELISEIWTNWIKHTKSKIEEEQVAKLLAGHS